MSQLTAWQGQVLAFGALSQAAWAVDEIAHGRQARTPEHLVAAIFNGSAESLESIFSPAQAFQRGLSPAMQLLSGKSGNTQPARYAVQLVKLVNLLKKNNAVNQALGQMVDGTSLAQQDAERAAEIYRDTISRLGPRIQVSGNREVLAQQEAAAEIRCSLLAGIRFAWLWQELGGRQWHLVFRRGRILQTLQELAA